MDAKEVLKKMNENYFSVAAIRRCRKDENYEVGDICRNSFDWNYEKDESTFEDDEPVELSGTCGMRIENLENLDNEEAAEAEKILEKALKDSESYPMRRKTPCFSYGDIRRVHRIYASN